MYSLPKWAMLSTGQSRAGACPGYFAKAGSVLREGELDDDDDDGDIYIMMKCLCVCHEK